VTTADSTAPSGPRSRWSLIAKIVISTALLALLFSRIDVARLGSYARRASIAWLAAALTVYLFSIGMSAWRWGKLLHTQHVQIGFVALLKSFLVATFYNNFLPSNIGGDVIRIADTVKPTGSRTLATTVVLVDRVIGLMALAFVAALGTSAARIPAGGPVGALALWGGLGIVTAACAPALLRPDSLQWLLRPLRLIHAEWIDARVRHLTVAFEKFRARPIALLACFVAAIGVQVTLVMFYAAVARSMNIPISPLNLATIVPISFIVQMLPLSINGFGLREATFGFYFTRLGLPLESAIIVSFIGAALMMLFSTSGAAVQFSRRH
jgi:glycosyltransferase 2 family protein